MALPSVCALLKNGLDLSCERPVGKYYQQVVLINYSDIDPATIVAPWTDDYPTEEDCQYFAQFVLEDDTSGFRFMFPEKSAAIFGTADMATNDQGYTTFLHHLNMLVASATEEQKCVLDAILKGKFVAAVQLMNGVVEIYGLQYGLFADDVTIDGQTNAGATPIILSSREGGEENTLPLVYKPQQGGDATADFDANFANTGS